MAEGKIKDIYIVKFDRYIGAYKPGRYPNISYAPGNEFTEFIQTLREEYPGYRLRCVRNWGIEEEVKKIIKRDLCIDKSKNTR